MGGGQSLDISQILLCKGKITTTMVPSTKMLIFLMWMHGRWCRTLLTWNIAEGDTFSWTYVVSFHFFLWLSWIYKLLIQFWYLEWTFEVLYVDRMVQNSQFFAANKSDLKIRKIAEKNEDNWHICHHTCSHDIFSLLDSWNSQQRSTMIRKIERITVAKFDEVLEQQKD